MMSKIELHSLAWHNYNPAMLEAHQKVMTHFDLPVQYTRETIRHGQWLNQIMTQTDAEVIGIIEPDLIPLNQQIVAQAIEYVRTHDSMIGCAQTSNHIPPSTHIFASPAFFFISRACYERMGRPSFLENRRADVGEQVSYRAEQLGIRYRTLYPTAFEREPREGVWPLGSFGYYGVGTVFEDAIYHLFQGRFADNAELFVRRCDDVVHDRFSTQGFHDAKDMHYQGNIVPFNARRKKRFGLW